jgi:hypothetical protein
MYLSFEAWILKSNLDNMLLLSARLDVESQLRYPSLNDFTILWWDKYLLMEWVYRDTISLNIENISVLSVKNQRTISSESN